MPDEVQRRVYEHDPIQEALCELRFRAPTTGWAILPGQLFNQLSDLYPSDPTTDLPFGGVTPQLTPQALASVQVQMSPGLPGRVRLHDPDAARGLFVTPGVLTVFVQRPYPKWESFSEHIIRTLSAMQETAGAFDIERIGMRYVNKIEVPDQTLQIERYFHVAPLSFPGVHMTASGFIGRSEQFVEGRRDRSVIATFASTQPTSGGAAFILDLDAIAQGLSGVTTVPSAFEVIKELRALEKRLFEASITDEARALFGRCEIIEEPDAN